MITEERNEEIMNIVYDNYKEEASLTRTSPEKPSDAL